MTTILALFGFAPTETQQRIPPALGWLALPLTCYGLAWVIELIGRAVPNASVYFHALGLVAIALLAHGIYRGLIHGDALSWSGWIRARLK